MVKIPCSELAASESEATEDDGELTFGDLSI